MAARDRACAVRGCVHGAEFVDGTPKTHCKGHGGGHRCPGPPGQDKCPLDTSINLHTSDDRVCYVKDDVQYCCGCFCAAFPDDALARNAKRCMHAKEQAHIVAVLAIYRRSTMAQTGVSGPVVVDEESFLDALFASAGQG